MKAKLGRLDKEILWGGFCILIIIVVMWLDSRSHVRRFVFVPGGDTAFGLRSSKGKLQWIEYVWWEDKANGGKDYIQFSFPYWILAIVVVFTLAFLCLKIKNELDKPTMARGMPKNKR